MHLYSDKDPIQWYEDGRKFEKAGLYANAIRSYKNYSIQTKENVNKDIKRCQAFEKLENDKSEEGIRSAALLLVAAEEFLLAEQYFRNIGDFHKEIECRIRGGTFDFNSILGTDLILKSLRQGINDEEFMCMIINHYILPKISAYMDVCELISEASIPEIMEVK